MKKTALLSGALTAGFVILSSSALAETPEKEAALPMPAKEGRVSPELLTNPENPVLIADDDAKEMRKEMSKEPFAIKTLKGKEYSKCEVLKVDPDGLFFRHSRGIAKLSFSDLSKEIRERFDYDSDKADKFIADHRAVIKRVAEQRQRQVVVVNNNSPQFGNGGFVNSGFGFGNSQFGFPFAFPFGLPRSDAAAPFFGFPNVSFQAGVPRRPGSPIAPGLISNNRFRETQAFVQAASGFPAPQGIQTVGSLRRVGNAPGQFLPTPSIFTSPPRVAPSFRGGIRGR